MAEGMDPIASWNLVTAVDAFLSAGFSPAELLAAVHPSDVASTQGTGFGGMESMRKMFVGRLLGEERPSDSCRRLCPTSWLRMSCSPMSVAMVPWFSR